MPTSRSDSSADTIEHVVVIGYDHWTEAVLDTLDELGIGHALVVTEDVPPGLVESHDARIVRTETVNEAAFLEAGADHADAVLVATFDDRLNVLAVLTAVEVVDDATIATFSDERRDATKLKRAGADTVVNLGPVVAELLVDSALSGEDPRALLDVLLADESVVDSRALSQESEESVGESTERTDEQAPIQTSEDDEVPATASELASESIDVAPEEEIEDEDGERSAVESATETEGSDSVDESQPEDS